VTGFSAAWLDLRERFDRAARSVELMRRFAALLPPRPRLVDLGAGSGGNVRALAPFLPGARWRLVDNDGALLALARARCSDVVCERRDLARELEAAIDDADGVTAAALADLVSESWLDRLLAIAARRGVPLLMALTTDGAPVLEPPAQGDAEIIAGFTRDQARDKGFGPALGARAPDTLVAAAARCGYVIDAARSDWQIEPADTAMLEAMLGFLAGAAIAAEPASRAAVESWHAARCADAAAHRLRMCVGHRDVLALPSPHS
jgi:hypothetical protein